MPQCSAFGMDLLRGPEWTADFKNSNFCPQWRSHTLALGRPWYRPSGIGHFMWGGKGMLTCVFFSSYFPHCKHTAVISRLKKKIKIKPGRVLANFLLSFFLSFAFIARKTNFVKFGELISQYHPAQIAASLCLPCSH